MKKSIVFAVFIAVAFIVSCGSTQGVPYRPLSGVYNPNIPGVEIIGTISTTFVGGPSMNGEIVYAKLLTAANEKYTGNIDVADIQWAIVSALDLDLLVATSVFEYTASGKVISLGEHP
jgi:hypothetical protein